MCREIILGVMCVLFIVGFFKAGLRIDDKKLSGVLWIGFLAFLFAFSMFLNFMLIQEQDELEKKLKDKSKGLPEYEETHGVYIIKKK
jgi:hypothetical protein